MASRDENERRLTGIVGEALRRWLSKARDAVLRPWRQYQMSPDPEGVFQVQGAWNDEVDTIIGTLSRISMDAWSQASDVPPVSRHSFVMAQLAVTQNLLVRLPDEVYNLIFAELVEGTNAGESTEQLAARVERVLSYTDSERWPSRARTIAQTETTRAYGAATVAAGMEQSRVTGRILQKRWDSRDDSRVRNGHREVDGEVVPIYAPWYVGGVPMLFPGDPSAPPDLVINCRCDVTVLNERGR